MLRLDSDWIRPVTVTLTNATVSSSEVIGSPCHVTKIIDEQTVQLTMPLKYESKKENIEVSGLDTESTVVDPGSSDLETGNVALEKESVVDPESASADPGCSYTETVSSLGDTGSRGHDPVRRLCDPEKDVRGSGIDVCETGGSVSEPKCDVSDAGCKIFGSKRNALRPRSRVRYRRSRVHEQVRDLGRYRYQRVKFAWNFPVCRAILLHVHGDTECACNCVRII